MVGYVEGLVTPRALMPLSSTPRGAHEGHVRGGLAQPRAPTPNNAICAIIPDTANGVTGATILRQCFPKRRPDPHGPPVTLGATRGNVSPNHARHYEPYPTVPASEPPAVRARSCAHNRAAHCRTTQHTEPLKLSARQPRQSAAYFLGIRIQSFILPVRRPGGVRGRASREDGVSTLRYT